MGKNTDSLRTRHHDTVIELEKFKLLIESVQDYAIFLIDKDGYILTWNKGAEKNKGYKDHEIINKHFSIFYTQEDKDARKPERELEIAQKVGRIEDEDWRVRKDGSKFWANVVITALYGQDGELVGFGKVTRNLTERKIQEDNLRKANVLLRQQQVELTRLNTSKDEFISLASHQLRTPATAVKQLLGMVLDGFQGDVEPHLLTVIQKAYDSNERQIEIVNSLLKVAQIDNGKVVLRKTAVDINKLLFEIIEELTDTMAKRKQSIAVSTSHDSVITEVDEQKIRMALENILDNASKYTYDGGSITVATKKQNDCIVISIQDTGVGIHDKDKDRLFKKFERLPNDLSQKVPGSGLGLYWVQQVISLHGGRIEVESKAKKGTTFHVILPTGKLHA